LSAEKNETSAPIVAIERNKSGAKKQSYRCIVNVNEVSEQYCNWQSFGMNDVVREISVLQTGLCRA
jgi:hypothetical protein